MASGDQREAQSLKPRSGGWDVGRNSEGQGLGAQLGHRDLREMKGSTNVGSSGG